MPYLQSFLFSVDYLTGIKKAPLNESGEPQSKLKETYRIFQNVLTFFTRGNTFPEVLISLDAVSLESEFTMKVAVLPVPMLNVVVPFVVLILIEVSAVETVYDVSVLTGVSDIVVTGIFSLLPLSSLPVLSLPPGLGFSPLPGVPPPLTA